MSRNKWNDTMYVQVYILARTGMTDKKIAQTLGFFQQDFSKLKLSKPALQDALRRGKQAAETTFSEYIFDRLSPEVKELWNTLNEREKLSEKDDTIEPY